MRTTSPRRASHQEPRADKRGLERREHRKRKEQQGPAIVRVHGGALEGPREAGGDERRDEIEDREERGKAHRNQAGTRSFVRDRHPCRRHEHRRRRSHRVKKLLPARQRNREQAASIRNRNPNSSDGTRAERGHGREVERKQERHDRRHERRPLEALPVPIIRTRAHASGDHQPGKRRQRKQQEDPHRQRHAAGVQELEDPAPLIDRRQDERQRRSEPASVSCRRPARARRSASSRYANSGIGRFSPVERSAGVAKPPSNPSTAMKSDSRLIDSSTAMSVTSASRPKADERRDEVPQRVRREERREEDRNRRRVHGVGRHRVAPRGFHLADDEQRDRDEDADRHANRRLQPVPPRSSSAGRAPPRPRARRPQSPRRASRRSGPPSRTRGAGSLGGGGAAVAAEAG